MRVAVTGGTGFVGSHTVAVLCAQGHAVRMLVRSPRRVSHALAPLGIDPDRVEVVTADVTDQRAVRAGVDGMDAIVHAASVYSFDPAQASAMARINDLGLRTVMEAAIDARLDPIVHVSSCLALLRTDVVDDVLMADSPTGDPPVPYAASKARQDTYLRQLQAAGHPVVLTYPGGVYGPHDPHDGESLQTVRGIARRAFTFLPNAGFAICDVRDVAAVHAAAMEQGRGPRRYMAGGHYTRLRDLVGLVAHSTGRRLPTLPAPAAMAVVAGKVGDRLRRRGLHTGVSSEGAWVSTRRAQVDNVDTERDLGVGFRPVADTINDQIRWMDDANRL